MTKMFNFGHTCKQGDLFGRCPTETDPKTGEASRDPEHWVSQHWHITLVIKFIILVFNFIIDVSLVMIKIQNSSWSDPLRQLLPSAELHPKRCHCFQI